MSMLRTNPVVAPLGLHLGYVVDLIGDRSYRETCFAASIRIYKPDRDFYIGWNFAGWLNMLASRRHSRDIMVPPSTAAPAVQYMQTGKQAVVLALVQAGVDSLG